MQRDAADWVARCGQCTLSKASARVMDPGDFRTRPVSPLFETLSADVLELSIPSTRRTSSSDKAEGSAANANPFVILGDEEQPWRARQQVIEARAARKMAARLSKLARCRAAGDVRCQGATSTLPHAAARRGRTAPGAAAAGRRRQESAPRTELVLERLARDLKARGRSLPSKSEVRLDSLV
jgi:hypothetical protein